MRLRPFLIVLAIGLGFIATLALFISMHINKTELAATQSIAAALSSANACNYTIRKNKPNAGKTITNCTDIALLAPGTVPTGYSIKSKPVAANEPTRCTLHGLALTKAYFTATGVK